MARQTLLWTAMPNGITENGEARISVLLSPRLQAENAPPVLSSFGDFTDWPETLRNSQFTLHFAGGQVTIAGDQTTGASRLDDTYGLADSALWSAMLPANTTVEGFAFKDMTGWNILSYSTTKMADRQRQLYQSLAAKAADQLPEISSVLAEPAWAALVNDVTNLDRVYHSETPEHLGRDVRRQFDDFSKGFTAGNLSQQQKDLLLFQLFHTPLAEQQSQTYEGLSDQPEKSATRWRTSKQQALPSAAELATMYDFHQLVAAMNQYPTLLRRLGLVLDVLIEPGAFNHSDDGLLTVAVALPSVRRGVTREPSVSPRVHCVYRDDVFLMRSGAQAPNQSSGGLVPINRGLLDISLERFALLQQDVDGTGLKTINTARTLARQKMDRVRLDPTSRRERTTGLPTMRNAGLMLVQRDRRDDLGLRFKNSTKLNSNLLTAQQAAPNQLMSKLPETYAEDLVRGYRFDIWDDHSKRWQSLCRRSARYAITGLADINIAEEEGIARLAATQSADRSSNPDIINLHEMLVAWTGWSLCAPMPGRIVDPNDAVADQGADIPPGIPLRSEFSAIAGSLPRLRYGRRYWVRARAVDLAANSLAPSSDDYGPEMPAPQAQLYLRYDPLRAPVPALLKPTPASVEAPQEGESMQRMAIRSFNATPDLNESPATQQCRRMILNESASVKDAEVHGVFDNNGQMDASFYAMLTSKDQPVAVEPIPSIPPPVPGSNTNPPGSTEYAVLAEGAALQYLPDPLCVEIAARIFDHPQFPDATIIPINVYPDNLGWPHAQPFKVQLYEQPGALPEYSEADRTLYIPLPKACRAVLRLSVKPSKQMLELLGIWDWLSTAEKNKLENRALDGQHWMLTPWREIELVHGVQKPLITPVPVIQVLREPGQTWAIPRFTSPMSLKSTEQAELMAHWNEPSQAIDATPGNLTKTDRAFAIKITEPFNYRGRAEHQIVKPDLIRAGSKGDSKLVDKVHEFEDTRYRRIEYWLEATTRFREYLPAHLLTETVNNEVQLTDKNIKVTGQSVVTWIPSSAPPPAPEVLYVLPTFQWLRSSSEGKQHSLRRGWGLRVYLDRPWNASGYGEMLAVVLPGDAMAAEDPNTKPGSQPIKNFVTQWGNDPAWLSPFVPGPAPKMADFPQARTAPDPQGDWLPEFAPASEADQPGRSFKTKNLSHPQIRNSRGLSSEERQKKLVNIAPHDVFYDPDRGLWYCDIDVAPKKSYYPFVRLALARYQPVSVDQNHLSNIVLADFMAFANDRSATISRGRDPLQRKVEVFGTSYSDSSGHKESLAAPQATIPLPDATPVVIKAATIASSTVIEVWVERLDAKLGEDFGWSRDPKAEVRESSGRTARPGSTSTLAKTRLAKKRRRARELLKQADYVALRKESLTHLAVTAPTLWSGTVVLPRGADRPNSSIRRRLVIAEYEEYLTDDEAPYNEIPTTKGRRLIYVEHITL